AVRLLADLDDAERARGDAVAAAVADVLLDVDGVELGPDDRARWARLQTRRVDAVLADVRHEEPPLPRRRPRLARGEVRPGLERPGSDPDRSDPDRAAPARSGLAGAGPARARPAPAGTLRPVPAHARATPSPAPLG